MNELDDDRALQPVLQAPHPSGRRVWLWYPAVILVAMVLFACAAPGIGMGTVFLALFLYLATAVGLIVVGIAVFGVRPLRVLAVIVCTLPGVWLLFQFETYALTEYLLRFPPPRPMFHNRFGLDERVLLPFWRRPYPMVDRLGHWVWADWDDNLLVVIARGNTDHGYEPIHTGQHETRFKGGDKGAETYVTVKRTRDALVVILPQGQMQSFQLRPGVARNWETDSRSHASENLLREAPALMTLGQAEQWNSFLAGYAEHPPERGSTTTSTPANPRPSSTASAEISRSASYLSSTYVTESWPAGKT